ncbi:serine hydrolase domain-containing protein [Croceitalea rosinachiae]|uniref:Serine hydrolase domain-containing protein n=1 Tax=Croceitalea rosinachiae TaxID=3075596 RepID=A0ABU3A6Y2_9FLAO|nr:serine hydrolase domain-containing protein [Croceitalea sp. F388]MDT0605714.1 serine hydrolase domain-containing protein [Croceitalea sp. F388]
MIKKIVLALIVGCSYRIALGQNLDFTLVKPERVGLYPDSLQVMNKHFHKLVDEGKLAGIQTAILRKGNLVHFNSYGYSNIEEKMLLDERSIFRIFSMTKPIVSVALMQLYEQDKFELQDPLYKFIPEFKAMNRYSDSGFVKVDNPIRIIDLLRHTSGFNYGRGHNEELNQKYAAANLESSRTNKEFVLKLSKLPLLFEPGTDWQYGYSTNICGYLIEVLSGKDLNTYLKDNILHPLNMHDTHFELPKTKIDCFTVGYGWSETIGLYVVQNQRTNPYTSEVTLFNGGGGLVSTTYDYLRFCQMLLNKGKLNGYRILKKETIDLMFKDHLQEIKRFQPRPRLPYGEYGFGLGFAIRGKNENNLERVYGWGGAAGTYFKIDLENELAYVMMVQLSPYRQLGLRQLIQNYIELSIQQ